MELCLGQLPPRARLFQRSIKHPHNPVRTVAAYLEVTARLC
jgi:hypothetical protein